MKKPSKAAYEKIVSALRKIKGYDPQKNVPILKDKHLVLTAEGLETNHRTWHLKCYKSVTRKEYLETIEKNFKDSSGVSTELGQERTNEDVKEVGLEAGPSQLPFTRSKSSSYKKKLVYFL